MIKTFGSFAMFGMVLFFPVAALAADPAPAASASQAPQEASPNIVVEEAKAPEQRVVCRREASTGSIMTKRRCRTVAQIRDEQQRSERTLEGARSLGGGPPGDLN